MALPVTDSWSQTSGSTQDITVYGPYAVNEGSFTVQSGANALSFGSGGYNTARRTDESPNAAQYSQIVITAAQASLGYYAGPAVRCSSSANTQYHVEANGSNFYLSKCVAGSQSSLASAVSASFAAGDVLRLEVEEVSGTTTLRVYKALAASPSSFTLLGTYTDTAGDRITAAGQLGVFGYGNGSNIIGTWSGGNLPGGPVTIDAAVETDAALPITATAPPTVGQAIEQDQAQHVDGVNMAQAEDLFIFGDDSGNESSMGGLKLFGGYPITSAPVSVGQAAESDSAQAITARLVQSVAQVSENDSAQSISASQARTLGQPVEQTTAQPIGAQLVGSLTQVSEADSAQPLTARLAVGLEQAAETDLAQPISLRLIQAVAQAEESDTAQPLAARVLRTVDQALESDSSHPMTLGSTGLGVAQVEQVDAAQPMQAIVIAAAAQAAEAEEAQPISARVVAPVDLASEGDSAQSITARITLIVAQVQESDESQQLYPGGFAPVDQAPEANSAQPIGALLRGTAAQAADNESAQQLTPGISATVGQVSELEAAQAFVMRLLQTVGQAQELDVAGSIQEPGAPEPEQPSTGTGGIGRLVTPSYRMQPPRRKRRPGEDQQQVGAAVDLAPGLLAGTAAAAPAPAPIQPAAEVDRWRLAREQDLEFETKVLHLI